MKRHSVPRCNGKNCSFCCTRIENFNVTRGGSEILRDVNIHIHCGELTAIIGPNGAGKSTLFKAILGEIRHTGQLKFVDAGGNNSGHPVIGYVPQQLSFDTSTPCSVPDLFAACLTNVPVWLRHTSRAKNTVRTALSRVKAEHLVDRRLGDLSGGELQRVLLALALDPVPNILLLDEPVSGIDRNGIELFYHIVSELRESFDMTIILISHDLPLVARYADRVVFLDRTVVCSGTPQEVFSRPEVRNTFGNLQFTEQGETDGEDET